MKAYLDILREILENGTDKQPTRMVDGKPVKVENGTIGLPCQTFQHDMREGFPLLTTKKMGIKSILVELEAFLGGITDKQWLKDRGCNIWNEWCNPELVNKIMYEQWSPTCETQEENDEDYLEYKKLVQVAENDLGTYYAWQMRRFGKPYEGIVSEKLPPLLDDPSDQIAQIVKSLKNNPYDRRMVCSMWCPDQIKTAALPSCHYGFNVVVYGDTINLQVTFRSQDEVLGKPYNIAYYATLLMLFGKTANLEPRILKIDANDSHIYHNQIEGVKEQLSRRPYYLPVLKITQPYEGDFDLFKWTHEDVELIGYESHPRIKFDVTV